MTQPFPKKNSLTGHFNKREMAVIGATVTGGIVGSVVALPVLGAISPFIAGTTGAALANVASRMVLRR